VLVERMASVSGLGGDDDGRVGLAAGEGDAAAS
jgi:hypothetical protein